MATMKDLIERLQVNPKNPRKRSDAEKERIKKSLREFPEMLEARPIVYANDIIQGGNGRFTAMVELVNEEGFELKPEYFKDVSNWTKKQIRSFVIKDNLLDSEWDQELLASDWSDLPLEEWGIELVNMEDEDDKYTTKVDPPTYEPSEQKPELDTLVIQEKTRQLLQKIDASSIPDEEKEFLRMAAYRHYSFDYQKIADYYAHSDKEVQELMEQSALVIIDFEKAIENGFVEMTKDIAELYKEGAEDE